jgi:hypothetical protein
MYGIVCVPDVWYCSLNERIKRGTLKLYVALHIELVVCSVSSGTVEVGSCCCSVGDKHGQHVSM